MVNFFKGLMLLIVTGGVTVIAASSAIYIWYWLHLIKVL